MKIDFKIKLDIYTVIIWIALIIMLILLYNSFAIVQVKQLELNQLIEDNKVYVFDYSCDSWDSKYYNCPTNESLRNITGTYCYNELICQNSVRKLKNDIKSI